MSGDTLSNEEMDEAEDFTVAYQSHATPIYRFLYWRTGDHSLAEDLTSTVFERAWRTRRSFHGGSQRAWLQRIARNVLIDHWRKRQAIPSDDIEHLREAATITDSSAQLDQAMLVERLQQALAKLPSEMQQVVRLRFMAGLSAKRVGHILQLSEGNVRIIQYRALRKLRKYLDD
jgi:RNA polymerase sigma-70 factor, ECF subfamily